MTITTEAPDFPLRGPRSKPYPSGGKKLGPAWRDVWTVLLREPDKFVDAWVVADHIAASYGLAPLSIVQLMSRATEVGILERVHKQVVTTVTRTHKGVPTTREAVRLRSHYRIKQ